MKSISCAALGAAFLTLSLRAQVAAPVRLDPVTVEAAATEKNPSAVVTATDLGAVSPAAHTPAGLAAEWANFAVAANGAQSFNDIFALRGLTNTPLFGDPAVTFYLDDLPLGAAFATPASLAGFARAELHRGPGHNTVFGRAGSAGVVTLTTPQSTHVAQADLRATAGNHGQRSLDAQWLGARTERADFLASLHAGRRDGWITNTVLQRTIDDQDQRSALARLRFRPRSDTEITLLAMARRARDGVQPLVPLGGSWFEVARSAEGRTALDAWNAALTATRSFSPGRFSATVAVSEWDLGPYESTLAFGPFELGNTVTQRQRAHSAELRWRSADSAPGRWRAGVFAAGTETAGSFSRDFGGWPFERSAFVVEGRDLALFGEGVVRAWSGGSLSLGLRLQAVEKTMERRELVPTPQQFALTGKSSAWLPKLTWTQRDGGGRRWFAVLGAGYKPGGFSAFTGNRSLAAFGPERSRTAEAGVTLAEGGSYGATLRVFHYALTGYQIERSFATSAVADDYLVVNAPRARSRGLEWESTWRPAAALELAAAVGVTEVTLREFTDPYTGLTYAGKRAPAVPTFDANLRATWRPVPGLALSAQYSAQGRVTYTEDEAAAFAQDRVGRWSARIGWTRGAWSLGFFGENLGDKRYYSAITPGTGHGTPGAPRTIGAELGWKY